MDAAARPGDGGGGPEPTTARAPEEKKAWARARGARRVVDVSAGRRSFCTGALSQRLSVNPLAHLHKRPCKRTGAERNVHHTPSSSSPCPRLLLLRRALRRGLGSSSTVSGSSGETGIPCARHAAGRCTFAAAAPSRMLGTFAHARRAAARRVLSLGARGSCLCQDAMRVMQGPWTPRCYCTVADLSRCIASHFITRVCSPAVSTPHGPLPLAGPPELCTDPRPKHLPVSVAVSRVRAATRWGLNTHWSRPEQMLPQTCT